MVAEGRVAAGHGAVVEKSLMKRVGGVAQVLRNTATYTTTGGVGRLDTGLLSVTGHIHSVVPVCVTAVALQRASRGHSHRWFWSIAEVSVTA